MPPLKINAKLLPMKAHYFLFHAGTAPILLFGPTIAKQLGYSAVTVGSMYSVLPLIALISKPLVCALADKFKLRRTVFLLSLALCLVTALALMFVPKRPTNGNIELRCHNELHMVSCNDDVQEIEYKNQIKTLHPENNTYQCQLTCKGTNQFVQDLCRHWKVYRYCNINALPNNKIHSNAMSKMDNMLPGKTATEKKYQASQLVGIVPDEFTFIGDIHLNHVFAISRCVFGRIEHARFSHSVKSYTPYCTDLDTMITTNCTVDCGKNLEFVEMFNPELKNIITRYEFWLLFLLFILNWASIAVNTVMSDTVCFDLLGNEAYKYGYTRLFGSLGWGLSSIFSGWLTDSFSKLPDEKNYIPLFSMAATLMVFDLIIALTVRIEQKNYSLSIVRDIGKLFGNIHIVMFTLCCFYIGVCSALIWQFLFWHLENISSKDDLLWSKTLQGLDAVFATILGELPFFFISGAFIKKLGHIHVMSLILFVLSLRLSLYSLLVNPVWVLPIELTNGFTFGIFYAAMASYASIIAPSGTEATTQGVFSSAFDGFGVSAGSWIGGFMFQRYGGTFMYRLFGIITLFVCLIHATIQYFARPSHEYKDEIKDYDPSVQYTTPTEASMMLQES